LSKQHQSQWSKWETSRVRKGDPHNIIYLCIKQYILYYNTKCLKKSLSFQALQGKLKDMYNIEKMLAVRNKCLAQFSQACKLFFFSISNKIHHIKVELLEIYNTT
jgi:hypothetical protein